jgi:hypothetical protein
MAGASNTIARRTDCGLQAKKKFDITLQQNVEETEAAQRCENKE